MKLRTIFSALLIACSLSADTTQPTFEDLKKHLEDVNYVAFTFELSHDDTYDVNTWNELVQATRTFAEYAQHGNNQDLKSKLNDYFNHLNKIKSLNLTGSHGKIYLEAGKRDANTSEFAPISDSLNAISVSFVIFHELNYNQATWNNVIELGKKFVAELSNCSNDQVERIVTTYVESFITFETLPASEKEGISFALNINGN